METALQWLNATNGADKIELELAGRVRNEFPDELLVGVVAGVAYGGSVEGVARLWSGRGKVYGFDTFTGHPKHLCEDPKNFEVTCMDSWYQSSSYGMDKLDVQYQRNVLRDEGISNAFLIPGEVHEESFSELERVHYVFLDMDIEAPTRVAYESLKDKIAPGGYLLIHDALPPNHLPKLHKLVYNHIIPEGLFDVVVEQPDSYMVGLRRKGD